MTKDAHLPHGLDVRLLYGGPPTITVRAIPDVRQAMDALDDLKAAITALPA